MIVEIFDREYSLKHYGPTLTEEFPDGLVRVWRRISKSGSRVLEANWGFYRKQADQSLKHLFSTRVRTRHYSVTELRALAKKAGWKYLTCYGSLEDFHRFTRNDFRAFLLFKRQRSRFSPADAQ